MSRLALAAHGLVAREEDVALLVLQESAPCSPRQLAEHITDLLPIDFTRRATPSS